MPEPYGTIPRIGPDFAKGLRQALGGSVDCLKPLADVASRVDAMQDGMYLLGEIIATLSIERNRRNLEETETGRCLVVIADRWIERYHKIKERTQA